MEQQYFVYILYSEKLRKYYCGQTNNIEDRINRHNSGWGKYTKSGVPWVLRHTITCNSRKEAIQLESKIKKRGIKRFLEDNGMQTV